MDTVEQATQFGMRQRATQAKGAPPMAPAPPPPPPKEAPPLRNLYGDAPQPQTEYVTTQQLAPYLVGMLRGLRLALYGAAGGVLVALTGGSRDWEELAIAAAIGALSGFLGRTEEAISMDTPKTTSVTEKVG